MNKHFNLSRSNDCVQCFKCVRMCPVKAIKVTDTSVEEDAEICINCGKCFNVCNKDVHYNECGIENIDEIIRNEDIIIVLDSTIFMEVTDYRVSQVREALIDAGFYSMEHTFDGLAIHDYIIDKVHRENKDKFYFNSNCIPFIDYIRKFRPEIIDNIFPYLNSTAISCKIVKEENPDKKVLLVTNCMGDFTLKSSSDIDYAILGSELFEYLKYKNIDIASYPIDEKKEEVYSMIQLSGASPNIIDGFNSCKNVIDYILNENLSYSNTVKFFLCEGGCYNSTVIKDELEPFEREQKYFRFLEDNFNFIEREDIEEYYGDVERFRYDPIAIPVNRKKFPIESIESFLKSMGIDETSGEYDCDACGYKTCVRFASSVLDNKAKKSQCVPYLMRENKSQKAKLQKMIDELNEAFSLTIPDSKLEKKLKSTPIYKGVYDVKADYFEVTKIIERGLYLKVINSLKLAADLQDCNVFSLIGIDKNILVSSILFHANAKTQPVLCVGDVVRYSILFEDGKVEANRSATFAKNFYNISDDVYNIIKYQKHTEVEILKEDFPKYLLPTYRLFKVINTISSLMTKLENDFKVSFKFDGFILYVYKANEESIMIDLYREFDISTLNEFLEKM